MDEQGQRGARRSAKAQPIADGESQIPGTVAARLQRDHGNSTIARALGGADTSPLAAQIRRDATLALAGVSGEPSNADRAAQAAPSQTGGQPIPDAVRARMERALGHDLSGVRVHTDGAAAQASDALSAHAFTMGEHIWFGSGEYNPGSSQGDELLAHELVHVVQLYENRLPPATAGKEVTEPTDAVEVEATQVARAVTAAPSAPSTQAPPPASPPTGTPPRAPGSVATPMLRDIDDARYASLTPYERVRQALDDEEEEDAIHFMGTLDAATATRVLERMQDAATSAFGNATMARAAAALVSRGGRLAKALEWMLDEGTDAASILATIRACHDDTQKQECRSDLWKTRFVRELGNDEMDALVDALGGTLEFRLTWMFEEGTDWTHVKAKILAVTDASERAPLKTDAWRDRFVSEFGNDEMAELVDALGLPLVTKLSWMALEGTDWAAMKARILSAQPEERVLVYDAPGMRDLFVHECDNAEMAEAVALLGGTLVQQLGWMAEEGTGPVEIADRIIAASAADRLALYDNPACVTLLRDVLGPTALLPTLGLLGGTARQNITLWGEFDFALLVATITPTADWVDGLIGTHHFATLLHAAETDGDRWRAAMDAGSHLDAVIAEAGVVANEAEYRGLFNLFGDATARTRAQMNAIYPKLIGVRKLNAGEMVTTFYAANPATKSAAANSWSFGKRPLAVDPSDAAFASFFNMMRPLSRASVVATNTLIFAVREQLFWYQTAPVTSVAYHPWATPNLRDIPTSYAGDGVVTLAAYAAGDATIQNTRAINGAVVAGPAGVAAQGDVSTSNMGSDSEGIATSVGGGEDRRAADGTGTDNRTAGPGLTYFQNHARHEFGHSVGRTVYQDVPSTGNAFAEAYGGWTAQTPGEFQAAMFSATDGETLTASDGTAHPVTAADVSAWAMGILQSGSEPTLNPVTAIPGGPQAHLQLLIASAKYGSQQLIRYLSAVMSGSSLSGVPSNAYQFTGYEHPGQVYIFASRWGRQFARYDKEAYNNCHRTLGWYSLSSPVEMFAESYTAKYSGGAAPASRGAGKDWNELFTQIERSPGVLQAAGVAPALYAAPAAPAAAEVEPLPDII